MDLKDLDEKYFERIVNDDVRKQLSESHATQLRSPEVVERWYSTLFSIRRSVQTQIQTRELESDPDDSEFVEWKTRSLRFLNAVDERILEARHHIGLANVLREAIEQHRKTSEDEDWEPTKADEELWASVENLS